MHFTFNSIGMASRNALNGVYIIILAAPVVVPVNLTRIGSLNAKVKKTASALYYGRSSRVKSWGSSDSLAEMMAHHSISTSRTLSTRKKKKKDMEEKKATADSDSDSAYGFYS